MAKFTFDQWYKVSNNNVTRREFLMGVSFRDLIDLLSDSKAAFEKAVTDLTAARQAFIDDCRKRDQAIEHERDNLQKEIDDQENRIRTLSARYQKALGSGAVKEIPDLKKQIAAATAARDEAAATLTALKGVTVEYDRSLFEEAEKALVPVQQRKDQLNVAKNDIAKMREIIEQMFAFDSDEFYKIRNAGRSVDIGVYDPQNWVEYQTKFNGC